LLATSIKKSRREWDGVFRALGNYVVQKRKDARFHVALAKLSSIAHLQAAMADNLNIAAKIKWFRGRAEEVRVTAEGMNNPLARGAMLQMSQTYERLAESLELVLERQKRNDVG